MGDMDPNDPYDDDSDSDAGCGVIMTGGRDPISWRNPIAQRPKPQIPGELLTAKSNEWLRVDRQIGHRAVLYDSEGRRTTWSSSNRPHSMKMCGAFESLEDQCTVEKVSELLSEPSRKYTPLSHRDKADLDKLLSDPRTRSYVDRLKQQLSQGLSQESSQNPRMAITHPDNANLLLRLCRTYSKWGTDASTKISDMAFTVKPRFFDRPEGWDESMETEAEKEAPFRRRPYMSSLIPHRVITETSDYIDLNPGSNVKKKKVEKGMEGSIPDHDPVLTEINHGEEFEYFGSLEFPDRPLLREGVHDVELSFSFSCPNDDLHWIPRIKDPVTEMVKDAVDRVWTGRTSSGRSRSRKRHPSRRPSNTSTERVSGSARTSLSDLQGRSRTGDIGGPPPPPPPPQRPSQRSSIASVLASVRRSFSQSRSRSRPKVRPERPSEQFDHSPGSDSYEYFASSTGNSLLSTPASSAPHTPSLSSTSLPPFDFLSSAYSSGSTPYITNSAQKARIPHQRAKSGPAPQTLTSSQYGMSTGRTRAVSFVPQTRPRAKSGASGSIYTRSPSPLSQVIRPEDLNGSDNKSDPSFDLMPEPSPAWSEQDVADIFSVPDVRNAPGPAGSDNEKDEEEEDDFDYDESEQEEDGEDDEEAWLKYDMGIAGSRLTRGRKKIPRDR